MDTNNVLSNNAWVGAKIASLVAQMVKNLPAKQETQVPFLGGEDPWRREWQHTPGFLPGKSQGWRSLIVYRPWRLKRVGPNSASKTAAATSKVGRGWGPGSVNT